MNTCRVLTALSVIFGGLSVAAMGQTTRPATTQPQQAATVDPNQLSYTLADLQVQHESMNTTAVQVSFFANGRMRVAQHCYILVDGRDGSIRYVYDWAVQGGGHHPKTAPIGEMPESQRSALNSILGGLPQSQISARDANAFLASWKTNGTRITRTYDRTKLPPEVAALCRFLNIPSTWL